MCLKLEIISQILIAIGTIGAVLVALFKEEIVNFIKKPKIEIDINDKNCMHRTEQNISVVYSHYNEIWIRAKIKNIGGTNISNIKFKCNSIKLNNEYLYPFDPNYFVWSTTHDGNPSKGSIYFDLAKNEIHYIDLFIFKDGDFNNFFVKPVLKQLPFGFPNISFNKGEICNIEANGNLFLRNITKNVVISLKIKYTNDKKIVFLDKQIIFK